MTLDQLLNLPELTGLTDQQVLDYGNEVVVIGGSDALWSYSGVALNFGDQAAEGLLQAIEGAGLVGAAQVYLSRGMQLSLQAVQDKLTAIGLMVPALSDVCNALKEIGITHGTRWQGWGVEQPTIESIAAARPTQRQRITHFVNEILMPALSNESITIEQIKAIVANEANWTI